MKIIFFGNSDFSVAPLEALIEKFEVIAIVTAPDKVVGRGQQKARFNPVKNIALHYNIPILQPEKLKNNTEFFNQLKTLKADLHVIVSYGKIIPKDMINIPPYSTINLHSSLLPKLRGAAPIQFALWQGLKSTGNTVQFITEKMDEGDIINQDTISIDLDDDYLSLEKKMSHNGASLLIKSILEINNNTVSPQMQNHSQATYTHILKKEDGAVYFSMSSEEIMNAFRALKYNPGIFLPLEIGDIKIKKCDIDSLTPSNKEGEILAINEKGIIVSCYEGTILLESLQAPNKKAINGKDFANGNRLKIGSVLK